MPSIWDTNEIMRIRIVSKFESSKSDLILPNMLLNKAKDLSEKDPKIAKALIKAFIRITNLNFVRNQLNIGM